MPRHITPEEHRDTNLFVILVDLDVVKAVDDTVNELDAQRLIVRADVDPLPSHQTRIRTRRIGLRRLASECPTVSAGLE